MADIKNLFIFGESENKVVDYKGDVVKFSNNLVMIGGKYYPKNCKDPLVIYLPHYGEYDLYNPKYHCIPLDNNKKEYEYTANCRHLIVGGDSIENVEIKSFLTEQSLLKYLLDFYKKEDPDIYRILRNRPHSSGLPSLSYATLKNIIRADVDRVSILSQEVIDKLGLVEHLHDSSLYDPNNEEDKNIRKKFSSSKFISPMKKVNFTINGDKRIPFKDMVKYGEASQTSLITEGLGFKFGVEIETSSGCVPTWKYIFNKLNLACEHDGSIEGGEYVTGILQGDAGFAHLYKILRVIQKQRKCKVDKTCGIHVHIGNNAFNKEFLVFAYILGEKLEKSIFSILPPSRGENMFCTKLPKLKLDAFITKYGYELGIDKAHEFLYDKLSVGKKLSEKINKANPHPGGRYCGRYQGIDMNKILRYCWLNLIPCSFNTRGWEFKTKNGKIKNGPLLEDTSYTIEFRNHSATLNYEKIKNWILICMAIVSYINNNKRDILEKNSIEIEDIVNTVYRKNSKALVSYIKDRRAKFYGKSPDSLEELTEYVDNGEYKDNLKLTELICV